ncbi:MAG: Gfo/Idh/MocA family oxidoreductase [Clostridiales bacterium]|nr:Gfo/Idh/MocA family oxidoreductase [Clostridiales bacterium]
MNKVKVMLAGIGGYGEGYVRRLFELDDKGKVSVEGLVEPFPQSCKLLGDIKARGWKIYNSLNDFYAEKTCELAVISTPIQFHTSMIMSALSHGSNVLCEKPLTGDVRDIEKLIEARDKAGKFVMIGYQWSHSDAILAMKRDVLAGVYGKPKYLKTLVLWPRAESYFKRGTGWAGKIKGSDGTLILDSVANNACAHYLHNIFFTIGDSIDTSLTPSSVKAALYRTNPIENFDTAIIDCGFDNGARSTFIASHSTEKNFEPIFNYSFENGTIEYSEGSGRVIVGTLSNGERREYGDPFADGYNKLNIAVDNVNSSEPFIPCGIETASAQVRCIAECAKLPIVDFPSERKHITASGLTYIEGLYDELLVKYNR